MSTPALFKWRHFLPEIILLNVRWYCPSENARSLRRETRLQDWTHRYALSYRDLEEMMAERGIEMDHSKLIGGC